ncbi:MAG: trigger factor family protein, partial [Candidatus Eremiobacteraeota bacterium]|nr:trigger factor family protein [Candidatus Eremiobacteraeota bacterium]
MSAATVKHLDPTQVELEISIENDELNAARERAFKHLVKNVRIPGFRPGKAPRRIFEAQYGTAGIEERAMDAVVPSAYNKALQENELEPVDQPQMELLPEEEGQPLRVRATVTVRPQFE